MAYTVPKYASSGGIASMVLRCFDCKCRLETVEYQIVGHEMTLYAIVRPCKHCLEAKAKSPMEDWLPGV